MPSCCSNSTPTPQCRISLGPALQPVRLEGAAQALVLPLQNQQHVSWVQGPRGRFPVAPYLVPFGGSIGSDSWSSALPNPSMPPLCPGPCAPAACCSCSGRRGCGWRCSWLCPTSCCGEQDRAMFPCAVLCVISITVLVHSVADRSSALLVQLAACLVAHAGTAHELLSNCVESFMCCRINSHWRRWAGTASCGSYLATNLGNTPLQASSETVVPLLWVACSMQPPALDLLTVSASATCLVRGRQQLCAVHSGLGLCTTVSQIPQCSSAQCLTFIFADCAYRAGLLQCPLRAALRPPPLRPRAPRVAARWAQPGCWRRRRRGRRCSWAAAAG